MMQQSDSVAAIGAAMALAQGAIEGATKGRVNPAFKSKYADLSSVWAACKAALFDNDLSVVQFPGEMVDNRLTLTTQLTHKSGEWMRATLSIPLSKVDAQGYGSAVTYARRYALASVVGVCPEDDDGNAASAPKSRPVEVVESTINDDQRNILFTLAEQSGADMRGFCQYYRIDALPALPAARFDHAKAMLTKKLNEGNVAQKEAA
ncbi:MAG TPA: ERF family protein [Sphingomonas sp.]|jgi:hypothetical protein